MLFTETTTDVAYADAALRRLEKLETDKDADDKDAD